jgi:hypothetical protein
MKESSLELQITIRRSAHRGLSRCLGIRMILGTLADSADQTTLFDIPEIPQPRSGEV